MEGNSIIKTTSTPTASGFRPCATCKKEVVTCCLDIFDRCEDCKNPLLLKGLRGTVPQIQILNPFEIKCCIVEEEGVLGYHLCLTKFLI
jgi:hypothetical protein